jgi:hypothetical protein
MIRLCSTHVAGVFHHVQAHTLEKNLKAGKNLRLVRDEENPHDAQAIRVIMNHKMIGFIPASTNEPYAALMDKGFVLFAKVTEFEVRRAMVVVDIYMSEKRGRGAQVNE